MTYPSGFTESRRGTRVHGDRRDPSRSRESAEEAILIRSMPGCGLCLTARLRRGGNLMDLFGDVRTALERHDSVVASMLAYGALTAAPVAAEAMRRVFGPTTWPVTWVDGAACDGLPIAGVQVFAVPGNRVQSVMSGGRFVGSVYECGGARHCWLGGLAGPGSAPRPDQAGRVFSLLQESLECRGFALGDVVRTWFFLDHLLDWYREFNEVRTAVYAGTRFRSGSLPASTGISGANPCGTALTAAAWAVQPVASGAHAEEVPSPLQCPAPAYGSSFSRAMQISLPTGRGLLISGTASISPVGESMWPGDTRRQVAQTMDVVEAILRQRGLSYADTTRATAYFSEPADALLFAEWCDGRGVSLPYVAARSGICRADLLFELELDAWRSSDACPGVA